jgi:hypothetical protein
MTGRDFIPIRVAEPIEGDDFYLVSGMGISVMRAGKVVNLQGAEAEKVRRWVLDRSESAGEADVVGTGKGKAQSQNLSSGTAKGEP